MARQRSSQITPCKRYWYIAIGLLLLVAVTLVLLYLTIQTNRPNDDLPIDFPQALVYNEGDCKLIAIDPDGEWEKTKDVYDGSENGKKCSFDVYIKETVFYNDDFSSIKSTSDDYPEIKLPVNHDTSKRNISSYGYVLAVDYKTNNIYALSTDDRYELDKLIVVDFSRRDARSNDLYFNIVLSNLDSPKHLVLDPSNDDFMFIAQRTGIYRYYTNGMYVDTPVNKPGITSVAFDYQSKLLYWTRSAESSLLERAKIQGSGYELIKASNNRLTSVTSLSCKTFYLEHLQHNIILSDKDRELSLNRDSHMLRSYDFKMMKLEKRSSNCQYNNGGCDHLCLSSSKFGKCHCKLGYRLQKDGKSCERVAHDVMVYVRGIYVGKRVMVRDFSEPFAEVMYPLRVARNRIVSFDTLQENHFYASDGQCLYRRHLHLDTGVEIVAPGIIAVAADWAASQIYVARKNEIRVFLHDFETLAQSKVLLRINDSNFEITSLALQPNRGYVFFAKKDLNTGNTQIFKMNSDGSAPKLFNGRYIKDSSSIAVDAKFDRLYWMSAVNSSLESVETFGPTANVASHDSEASLHDATFISAQSNWVYVSSPTEIWRTKVLPNQSEHTSTARSINMRNQLQYTTYAMTSQPIIGQNIYTKDSRIVDNPDYPCRRGSRKCQGFCFVEQSSNGTLSSKCDCFDGETIDDQGNCSKSE